MAIVFLVYQKSFARSLFLCVSGWILDVDVARTVWSLAAFACSRWVQRADGWKVPLDTFVIALVLPCGSINTLTLVGTTIIPLLALAVQLVLVETA